MYIIYVISYIHLHTPYKHWLIPILGCLPYIMPTVYKLIRAQMLLITVITIFSLTDQPLTKSNCFLTQLNETLLNKEHNFGQKNLHLLIKNRF